MSATLNADPIAAPAAEPGGSSRLRLILVLGSLVAIGPLTIDMYLPALPALTEDLQTTNTAAKMTLTGTLLGLGLGQLVIGPLSDSLGRRGPLLAGLIVHVVASALCVFAPTIGALGPCDTGSGMDQWRNGASSPSAHSLARSHTETTSRGSR
jgi:DHA1 family bicyclomycin/chloramphenicol resistance-like MFS transporter